MQGKSHPSFPPIFLVGLNYILLTIVPFSTEITIEKVHYNTLGYF